MKKQRVFHSCCGKPLPITKEALETMWDATKRTPQPYRYECPHCHHIVYPTDLIHTNLFCEAISLIDTTKMSETIQRMIVSGIAEAE